ncbi:MAG: PAS domain S-box protein [Bacteroidales bacterium]|nr:PAS domain S-box protein [Bacteroidales bacterium]
MKSVINHRKKVIIQVLIPIIAALLLSFFGYFFSIYYIKNIIIEERKNQAKEMVNNVYSLIEKYYDLTKQDSLSEKQAKETIILTIKNLRYGSDSKDYFWLIDDSGQIISHPFFNDSTVFANANPQYRKTLSNIALKAKSDDEGFYEYNWQWKDNATRIEKKISYVKNFKPWKWVVGTGFYIKEANSEIKERTKHVVFIMFFIILLTTILFIVIYKRSLRNLKQIISDENELLLSEKRFKGMAHHINSGLIMIENKKIVFFNKKICEIFGLSEDEINSFSIYDFLMPEEKERFRMLTENSITNNNPIKEINLWIKSKDGKKKFIISRFSYERRDNIDYTYILTSDITEKKEIEIRIKSLSETIDQSPDTIVITDLQGNITYVNRQFVETTGYSIEEVMGQNPKILKSDKMHPSVYIDLWKTITEGKIWEGELLNKKKNGELFWEQTIVFPVRNDSNEIVNYSAIKTNLTRLKYLENELKQAKEQAKISDNIKTTFLNNISHEVRTPLTAIEGFSNLLKEELLHSDEAFEYLMAIHKNSEILLKLFQDIIDYSTIESGAIQFNKNEINIYTLFRKIVSKYNTNIATEINKPIELVIDKEKSYEQVIINTDKKRFSQIIDILLSNAIKYTNDGHINIGFNIDYENIVFYIKDTGIGIPPDEYKVIFDSFTHGNNMYVSLHKGTGLGLNIANRLLQLMGGRLWFESEENKGTIFYFSLPSIDVKNYSINNLVVDEFLYPNLLEGKKIIIAEDNDENFLYLKSMLGFDTPDISWVKTGNEVLSLLEKKTINYDLILMNVNMPIIDGFNTSRTIKTISNNTPLIGMASSNHFVNEEDIKTFDTILYKPFPKNILFKKISEVIIH